ncbi:MAG: hypothetical protein D8M57_15800 [Candidatus Scalindua sp. AMX11]|nr:MAG: hypothetical protein D8M57_15800 [Candidatus Scalindua sp. AMX11]GJQ60685.1 MAG: hypothetical protein SCALA701_34860 [Candidatus Scalindua sp.]
MNTMKLKEVFTILLIFLFCFYGISLSQGEADGENGTIAKDFGRIPVNNEKEIQSFDSGAKHHQTVIKKEGPFTFEIAEEKGVLEEWSISEGHQSDSKEKDIFPSASASQTESSPGEESGIEPQALDERPFPDGVGEEISDSDTTEEKDFQEDSSVTEDDQKIADDKEASDAPPLPIAELSTDEELPLSEEENTSFLEEDEPPISHQVNADERESEYTKDEDIAPDSPEPFPDGVEEEISDSDTTEEKDFQEDPSVNEDDQKIAGDKEASDARHLPVTELSTVEELLLSEEENTSFLEEDEPSIGQQVNADERESEYTEEEDIAPDLPKPFPAPAHDKKTFFEFGIDDSKVSGEASLSSEDKQEVDTDSDAFFDVREKDISPAVSASETESSTGEELPLSEEENTSFLEEDEPPISHQVNADERESEYTEEEDIAPDSPEPFPDGVEEEISDSDTTEEKDFQEDSSVNGDDQKIADDKEASDARHLPVTELSTVEELLLSEEENTSFLEEDEPSIGQQVNADERESEYTEEEDIAPDLPKPFPAPVHDKKTFSKFGIDDSKVSGEASLSREDKQEVDTDSDAFFDVREKDISPAVSASETESPPGEESGLESQALEKRPFPDGVEEENPPIDSRSIGKRETESGEPAGAVIEGNEESMFTWNIWHSDPTHNIILAVVIALVAAKIGGWIARSMRHPKVVGKLIAGMLLGNIYLFIGPDYFDFLKTMPFLKMISYFGTLILLLTAGLHTDLRAIFRVGVSSVLVCFGGMAASAGLGIIISHFLLPDISNGSKVLLSIVLCSTSTGLLFAILNELKLMNTLEGRVIVGATILTEIIVILSFGIVSGIVVEGGVSLLGISLSFGVASLFLITAVILIFKYGEKFGNFLTNRLTEGLNIPIIVILSLLTAFMFGSIGLHTVIGAFIAGLFLRNVKLRSYDDGEHRNVESYIRPFYALLVPILFVRVGALVDITSFFNLDAVLLGLAITSAAVLGKLFCAVCPIEKGTKRLVIGFGMAMKLEGTLILAGIGKDVGIFSDTVFSSLIMAIVFTSTVCPSLMKMFVLRKKNSSRESICIDPEKAALAKVPVKKRIQLKIFGLSLI